MPNRTVAVELKALVGHYVAGMKQAQVATTEFASKAQKQIQASKDQLTDMSNKTVVAGGLMLTAVGALAKTYADFDKQMSAVAATGDDARASLGGLRAAALKAGKDTAFSATEAAQGVENLLKAGVKASDVMGGALAGALSLAAAGEVSVADAAETAAMAMTQFHLQGSQVGHVADLLAAGAGKAQGEVSDLSMALRQSGLVASQFGLSVEDTTGTLSAFASSGLIGSDAGTSFKTMLISLANPAEKTRKLMSELGISAYDAQGHFVGVTDLAGQLQSKLGGLSQSQRDQALAQMFGNDAIRAANVLYQQGSVGIQKWIDQTNDAGYAAEVAATRLDNLAGDWEKFTGSVETAALQSGSGLNTYLRNVTQSATGLVDSIGELPAPVLESIVRLTALVGGGLLAVGMFGKLTVGVSSAIESFANLRTQSPKLASGLGMVGKAAGAAGAVFAAIEVASVFGRVQQDAIDRTYASLADVAVALAGIGAPGGGLDKLDDQFGRVQSKFLAWQTGEQAVTGVGDAIKRVSDASRLFFGGDDSQVSRTVASWFGTKTEVAELEDQIVKTDQALAAMDSGQAAEAFAGIRAAAENAGVGLEDLTARFPEYKATLASVVAELGVAEPSLQEYADWMGGKVPQAVQDATAAHPELVANMSAMQKEAAGGAATLDDLAASASKLAKDILTLSGSQIGMESAIDDAAKAAKKNGETLDVNTAKGRANKTALDNLATSTLTYRDNLIKQEASAEKIADATERGRNAWIKSATAMGMSGDEAKALAEDLFAIPAEVESQIKTTVDRSGMKEWESYKPGDKRVTIRTRFVQTASADGNIWGPGLVRQFASGGFGEPQVRPFQGDAGVNWGEAGSGPWEAFISGAPQKRDRSLAIWREVGRRLLGSFSAADVVQGFADGGIAEPSWNGQSLSYWADQLKNPLEYTQLLITIRDLKAELAEKHQSGKSKGKYKLTGLDRTEAQQRLAEAEADKKLADEAAKLNGSSAGSIDAQIAAWQAADQKSQAAAEAAEQAAAAAEKEAEARQQAAEQRAATVASNSKGWQSPYLQGGSIADLLANLNAGASTLSDWNDDLAAIKSYGMNATLFDWLVSQGPSSASLADEIANAGQSAVDLLNQATGNLGKLGDQIGNSQVSGAWTAASGYTPVQIPGYMSSGAVLGVGGAAGLSTTYAPVYQISQQDPWAAARAIDQTVRYL